MNFEGSDRFGRIFCGCGHNNENNFSIQKRLIGSMFHLRKRQTCRQV